MVCLNVGCGDVLLPGFVNLDLPGFDATNRFCWSRYETGSVSVVNMDCVLPHIKDGEALDVLVQEVARVLVPGEGLFTFSAPDWRFPKDALQDVHHYRLIGPRTFWHFTRKESVSCRPVEASGVWFERPTWRHRPVSKNHLEGYAHPIIEGLAPLTGFPIGSSQMTLATHVLIRTRLRWLLRSGRLNWRMKRNNIEWS